MKKMDIKDNKKLTSLLAMILATCVVIGLLSSTTIKLASATLLLKNSRIKNAPVIGEMLEDYVEDNQPTQAPTTQAPVTQAPTTKAPETTKPTTAEPSTDAPTTQAPTTQAPTTQAPTTEKEETQAPETEAAGQSVEEKQAILSSFKDVIGRAKLKGAQPGFTKATYRSLEWNFFANLFYKDVEANNPDYFVSEDAAKANPVVVPGKTVSNALCIENDYSACLLDANDAGAVDEAIKSASKELLPDGTVKIVIVLNDEANPAPSVGGKAPADGSFTGKMFPVVTGEQVRVAMDYNGVERVDLTYTDCTVEVIYKPATGEIVSMKQITNYELGVVNGYLTGAVTSGTVTEVSEYYNFVY